VKRKVYNSALNGIVMDDDRFFVVKKIERESFAKRIAGTFPDSERAVVEARTLKILDDYVGIDGAAIQVLDAASSRGEFKEFASRLEAYHVRTLMYSAPETRLNDADHEAFFAGCYHDLAKN
jgi:hypothetical protein